VALPHGLTPGAHTLVVTGVTEAMLLVIAVLLLTATWFAVARRHRRSREANDAAEQA
jgi:hypothetical protein